METQSEVGFFNAYSEYYRTSKSGFPNRLQGRYKALIEYNLSLIKDQRILDIASHDGRWSFAAIKNGAKEVTGIEARKELVERAVRAMHKYGVQEEKYNFIVGDVHDEIHKLETGSFDTVFLFGFFYHTLNHMQLLGEIRRLKPKYLILDTRVSTLSEEVPIIELHEEDSDDELAGTRSKSDNNKTILTGAPNQRALKLMLKHIGFDYHLYDWDTSNTSNWDHLEEYRAHRRISLVSKNRYSFFEMQDENLHILKNLVRNKQFESAVAIGLQHMDDHQEDPEWNYLTAFSLHITDIDYQKALEFYDKALCLKYAEFLVRYNRGSLLLKLGRINDAKEDLLRAIEINSLHGGARNLLRKLQDRE